MKYSKLDQVPAKKEKKKVDKKYRKKLENKLDKIWSEKVCLIGRCECCGKTGLLHAHHLFSRSRKSTRWDINNGCCLCPGCHVFSSILSAHKAPLEFSRWLMTYKHPDFLSRVEQKSLETKKWTIEDLEKELKNLSNN